MITNESGIHTFSLKLQCKYSEIQNIIEQNECICTGKGKLGLSSYYQMPQFKDIGVEIQLGQSVSRPCWLILIINPSSLLSLIHISITTRGCTARCIFPKPSF